MDNNPDQLAAKADTAPIASPAAESGASASVPSPTTTPTTSVWQGAIAAYGQAFDHIKKNPNPALLVIGAYLVVSIIGTAVAPAGLQSDFAFRDFAILIALYLVVGLAFLLAMLTYAFAIADRKVISVSEFMRFDSRKYLFVFVASLISSLLIGLSALAFLIPLIWTIPWFFFSAYVVFDKNSRPADALSESRRLAQNHKAKVWGLIGVAIVMTMVASVFSFLPMIGQPLGDAVSAAINLLIAGASAILYRWLQAQQP